jgi:hypothetical protein
VWFERRYWRSLPFALSLLVAGVVASYYAAIYATVNAGNTVPDIILSNTQAWDVDGLFVYGTFCLILFVIIVCLARPYSIPYVLSSLGLFYLVRSMFIIMTHLGAYPTHISLDLNAAVTTYFFGADLFFSGHTGAPFLLALIFWRDHTLRYLFLTWSVFFATVVLLGHFHYTIDVASAFAITYTIYHASRWLFTTSYELAMAEGQTL